MKLELCEGAAIPILNVATPTIMLNINSFQKVYIQVQKHTHTHTNTHTNITLYIKCRTKKNNFCRLEFHHKKHHENVTQTYPSL